MERHTSDLWHLRAKNLGCLYTGCLSHCWRAASGERVGNNILALYLLPGEGLSKSKKALDGKCWQLEAKPNVSG